MDRAGWALVTVAGVAWACGGGPPPAGDVPPAGEGHERRTARALPPPGFGTLRQDAFTVALRTGSLQIKVTPLAEEVIRLAAPDTYDRLRSVAEEHRARARASAQQAGIRDEPLLFLVSFFTFAPQAEYTPTDLQIVSEGRLYRALEWIPITPGFGTQLLRQEETQIAVYAFDPAIDLNIPLAVRYGTAESNAWEQIISVLESERARVRSRATGEGAE